MTLRMLAGEWPLACLSMLRQEVIPGRHEALITSFVGTGTRVSHHKQRSHGTATGVALSMPLNRRWYLCMPLPYRPGVERDGGFSVG